MKDKKQYLNVYFAIAWAIFTLGAIQLALILAGPLAFFIAIFICSALFAFFLLKTQHPPLRSFKSITPPYLLSTAILAVANLLYGNVIFLEIEASHILFQTLPILIYLVPLLATIPFLRKAGHVSK